MLAVVTIGGLLGAIFLGNAAAKQELNKITLVIGGIFALLLVLNLGRRYWYAIPITLALDLPTFQLGARNVNLGELAIIGCSLVFAIRIALKQEHLVVFRLRNVPILLFVSWVTLVYCMNPVGLAGFGSEMGGGRFYMQIFMGFAAFLIVSSQDVTENDLRWIFGLLLVGTFLDFGRTLLEYFVLGRKLGVVELDLDSEGIYTWHQSMSAPAMMVVLLLFSRWSPSQVFSFSHLWRASLYLMAIPAVMMSGKRAAMAQLLLFPLISAAMRRQYRYFAVFGLAGLIVLCGVLLGQGTVFNLPLTAQRALSWLPAEWDPELDSYRGGSDQFREELRTIAMEKIAEHPWIAEGFAINITETARAYYASMLPGSNDFGAKMAAGAMGRAWHNVWLGYAADFGIPLSIIQAFIFGVGLFTAFRVFRLAPSNGMHQMMAAFIFLYIFRDVLLSHTSGHTALDAFSRWWMYGMVFAMARRFIDKEYDDSLSSKIEPERNPVPDPVPSPSR